MLRLLLNNMQRDAASVLRAGTGLNRGVQQSTAFEGFLLRNIRIGNLNETGIVGTGAKPFSTKARLHMEETQKVARRKAVENASYLVSLWFVIEFLSRFTLSLFGCYISEELLCLHHSIFFFFFHPKCFPSQKQTALVIGMVGLTYASVPLYRMFCQATGYGGTTQRLQTLEEKLSQPADPLVEENLRELKIHFNADVTSGMNWKFTPTQRSVRTTPGESTLAFYTVKNLRYAGR